jgi:hypothetical protein
MILRCPCKISKPYDNPFWENEPRERRWERERREEKKNALYSGHLRLCQQQRAAHALRSDQFQKLPVTMGEVGKTEDLKFLMPQNAPCCLIPLTSILCCVRLAIM